MHCDHTVHFSADLSLGLDSPTFWAPCQKVCPSTSSRLFLVPPRREVGMHVCNLGVISQERLKIKVKLLLSANRKSYMPCRLAQQRMTLSDLAVAELLVLTGQGITKLRVVSRND